LRIAVLSRHFSSTGGGAERYSIALVEQLAAQHEVHVFAQTIAHAHPGVHYHPISMPLRKPRWINQLWFAYATWKQTRQGFDVVHSHENTWHGNVQTVHVLPVKHTLFDGRHGLALALRWLKVCTSPRLLAYLWLERARYAMGAGPKRIVLTSHALHEVMARAYPQARVAMEVIAPGIAQAPGRCSAEQSLAARASLGLPAPGRGLLFVGNDFQKKGLPALLQTLQTLPPDVWLAVVGQGEQNTAMRQRVHALGLDARVHFLGALRDMDLAYRAADCLVHPTLEDTYAMVVLEAMAQGLPVVVSSARYCGISAELRDGVNAVLLSDPRDAVALTQALNRVLNDAALAADLSMQAQQFAAQRSWSEVARRYLQTYSAVAPVYRQRWLVLAHAFNMDGRAASQTITDKLPHLEQAGIEVVVLSGVSGKRDHHFEHYQLWPAAAAGIRFELRHVLRRHWGSGKRYRSAMLLASLLLFPFMLVEKLLRPVESSWSWWLSAYLVGRRLMRERPFDLIYSTGGAFAAHVAGAALKRATGTRWLAEVHDPMVVPGTVPHTAQQKMQARIEGLICAQADVAIWFTDQALASARLRHPELGERGHVMLPGVDAPAYALAPYQPTDKLVLGHFGSLSLTRNLSHVMAALDQLLDQQPDLRGRVELQVTGGPLDSHSTQALAQMRHADCVRHFGRIETDPHSGKSGREQILQRMRSADVLLLIHGIEPICAEYMPSKMYEYLWMQRPILAAVYCNPQMAGLLEAEGHLVALMGTDDTSNRRALSEALQTLVARWRTQGLADNGRASQYTTQRAVHTLLSYLDQGL
jgi:glycosyltransferase involved in cell wall biosynthesis